MVWCLCVHSPLPDPWLSWALMWTSFLHEDPGVAGLTLGGNDSAVNTDGYLGCSSSLSHWLVLFFFLPWEEQIHCCHHVSVYKYNDAWLWFSWYLLITCRMMMCVQCMLSYGMSVDVLWPCYGIAMCQAAALLLVPDITSMKGDIIRLAYYYVIVHPFPWFWSYVSFCY